MLIFQDFLFSGRTTDIKKMIRIFRVYCRANKNILCFERKIKVHSTGLAVFCWKHSYWHEIYCIVMCWHCLYIRSHSASAPVCPFTLSHIKLFVHWFHIFIYKNIHKYQQIIAINIHIIYKRIICFKFYSYGEP